jgi:hypothetical protein
VIEIFLLWTLVAGEPHDVDAFTDRDQCIATMSHFEANLQRAREAKPELAAVTLVGCVPLQVLPPQQPDRPKESM